MPCKFLLDLANSVSKIDLVSALSHFFEVARSMHPSIIFIDEIDSIARSRSNQDSETSRRVKTELFVQMDGMSSDNNKIIIMAATNTPDELDAALLRRFTKLLYIPLPPQAARQEMFTKLLKSCENADFNHEFAAELAQKTEGLTGSDIAKIVQNSKMQSIHRLQNSEFFRTVHKLGSEEMFFTPCYNVHPDARKMSLRDIPAGKLIFYPQTTKEDVLKCCISARSTTSMDQLRKMEKFSEERAGGEIRDTYPAFPNVPLWLEICDAIMTSIV